MEGELYMRKRKHTNSCLLSLLSICASIAFVLLAGVFGLYVLSEKPTIYEEQDVVVTSKANKDSVEVVKALEPNLEEDTDEEKIATPPKSDTLTEESIAQSEAPNNQEVASNISQEETLGQAIDEVEAGQNLPETRQNLPESSESAEVVDGESAKTQPEDEDFEEVPFYDAYVLKLDENIVNKMDDVYNNGQIDYQNVVNKMFKNLSLSDQLRLLNIIFSKVQNININEVWNMIKDGIDDQDSIRLQELVRANFTLEELDELYVYYQSMEIAESE